MNLAGNGSLTQYAPTLGPTLRPSGIPNTLGPPTRFYALPMMPYMTPACGCTPYPPGSAAPAIACPAPSTLCQEGCRMPCDGAGSIGTTGVTLSAPSAAPGTPPTPAGAVTAGLSNLPWWGYALVAVIGYQIIWGKR